MPTPLQNRLVSHALASIGAVPGLASGSEESIRIISGERNASGFISAAWRAQRVRHPENRVRSFGAHLPDGLGLSREKKHRLAALQLLIERDVGRGCLVSLDGKADPASLRDRLRLLIRIDLDDARRQDAAPAGRPVALRKGKPHAREPLPPCRADRTAGPGDAREWWKLEG